MRPSPLRKAAQSPLEEHLNQFIADLRALNRDSMYVDHVESQVRTLMRECDWKSLRDVTADSFQAWRAKQSKSPKTLNEYLGSNSNFLSWLEKNERIPKNPLKHVQKVDANGEQVRPRRAFSDDEITRLLKVAGQRKVVYLTAVFTGLRRSELANLEPEDIHLDAEKPFLNVRASTTKNHKQAIIALHPDVIEELTVLIRDLPASVTKVFKGRMPTMTRFKADLKAAGNSVYRSQGPTGRLSFVTSHLGNHSGKSWHRAARGDGNHAPQ